jgi:uncharacterized protein (DUF4415 family)
MKDNRTTKCPPTGLQSGNRNTARLPRIAEAELRHRIAGDRDRSGVPSNWHEKAEAAMPIRKRLVSMRLDTDIPDWLKRGGLGYQTRMNAVLRSFMEEEKRRGAGRVDAHSIAMVRVQPSGHSDPSGP